MNCCGLTTKTSESREKHNTTMECAYKIVSTKLMAVLHALSCFLYIHIICIKNT